MPSLRVHAVLSRFFADYGMLGVLLLLCLYYTWATLQWRHPVGRGAAREIAARIGPSANGPIRVLIVAGTEKIEADFAETLEASLRAGGHHIVDALKTDPPGAAAAIERLAAGGASIDVIAATDSFRRVIDRKKESSPALAAARVLIPQRYLWPTFLTPQNLLNVANQIVVIAVIAVGMTMVIIAGGIDLSVGSLVALSAVVAARLILVAGGEEASPTSLVLSSAAAIGACGLMGAFSGLTITLFRVPPFIATLGVMQVASGLAFMMSGGRSIYQIPAEFTWLGRGASLFALPNAVVLMAVTYVVAGAVMSRTRLGRHIYAVGGNRQAARLSGIRVNRVLLLVYVISGLMAGLGGVIEASELKSGAPTYGIMYELYVIAAVVVGGTSLAGGQGSVFGTLIGAFIIAVIRNGMNLTDVEPYAQKVVLGLVILGAVLLDMVKKKGWRGLAASE